MPNRILKESITTSETIDMLTAEAECTFHRLLVVADDFGRFDARAPMLIARLYPLRVGAVSTEQINSWLDELERAGLVRLYQVDDQRYGEIITWEKHQRIRNKRSRFPAPPEQEAALDSNSRSTDSNSRSIAGHAGAESESESESESRKPPLTPPRGEDGVPILHDELQQFLAVYPKASVSNENAVFRMWQQCRRTVGLQELLDGATKYAEYVKQAAVTKQHVKLAQNWLKEGGWEADYDLEDNSLGAQLERAGEAYVRGAAQ